MTLILKDGTKIEAREVLGVVPARLVFVDARGKRRTIREHDVQQITPALEESLKHLEG